MPPEAISLALAASIYPPALAVVIALGRGTDVRLRVALFTLGAYLTVLVTGALILRLFSQAGASKREATALPAALYILAGLVLLAIAVRLHRRPAPAPKPAKTDTPSRTDRYLESRKLVVLLGLVLYIVPSPIYIGAIKAIADTKASTSEQLGDLALTLLIMLWLIELPMVMLILLPGRSARVLERINVWITAQGRRHGRTLAVTAATIGGVYLLGVGVLETVG